MPQAVQPDLPKASSKTPRRLAFAAAILGLPLLALAVSLTAYPLVIRYGPTAYGTRAAITMLALNAFLAAAGPAAIGLLTRGDVRTRAGNTLAAALAGLFIYWIGLGLYFAEG